MSTDPLDLHAAIRVRAAAEVRRQQLYDPLDRNTQPPSGAFVLRQIQMSFCEWSHTPLPQVLELPLDFVLQWHYEHMYREMARADDEGIEGAQQAWHDVLDRLADSPEESLARAAKDLQSRAADEAYHRSVVEEDAEAARLQKIKSGGKKSGVFDDKPSAEELRREVREGMMGGGFSMKFD